MNRAYILGPMSSLPDHNRPAFFDAADQLREAGYSVVNPAELDDTMPVLIKDPKLSWQMCMARDIAFLVGCDLGVALPGWHRSRGAKLEALILHQLGKPVLAFPDLTPVPASKLPKIRAN